MLIERIIGNTNLAIDPESGNDIYLEKYVAQKLGNNAKNLNVILEYIYRTNCSKKRLPLVCMWELTNACNFNCPFCFIHNCNTTRFQNYKDTIHLIDKMVDAGLLLCTLTGGEVLLHPEFESIYRYMKSKGVIVEIYSNLSLLTEEHLNLFRHFKPYKIEVTLYGHDNKSYHSNTDQAQYDFDCVFNNVKKLQSAGINVICKTTATVDTYSSIYQLCDLCDAEKLPYYFSFNMHPNYVGHEQKSFEVPLQIKKELLLKRAKRNGYFVDEVDERKKAFYCSGSRYGCYISYDFRIRLCHQAYRVQNSSYPLDRTFDIEQALSFLDSFIAPYIDENHGCCKGCSASQYCKVCGIDQMVYMQSHCQEYIKSKCIESKALYTYVKNQING